ncbi:hypothetical protein KIPB_015860, partial [Kipferlia bialata]|eukprot:g15860.t1
MNELKPHPQPPTLTLYTCDMVHPIPMDIPVGMLKSLASPSDIGPLILSATFSPSAPPFAPATHPTPYPGNAVLEHTQFPTVPPTAIASLPGIVIDTDSTILGGCPFTAPGGDTVSSDSAAAQTQSTVTVLSACHSAILTLCGG